MMMMVGWKCPLWGGLKSTRMELGRNMVGRGCGGVIGGVMVSG